MEKQSPEAQLEDVRLHRALAAAIAARDPLAAEAAAAKLGGRSAERVGPEVKHAGSAALDRLEPLLAHLRALPGLKETARGVFYRKSRAILHFHEDPAGLFADVRDAEGEFMRLRVETEAEQAALVAEVEKIVSA